MLSQVLRARGGGPNVARFVFRYWRRCGTRRLFRFLRLTIVDNVLYGEMARRGVERRTGLRPALQLTLTPLAACNLHCLGCYAADYRGSDVLDEPTATRVIAEARALGIRSFAVLGGEPLLWDGLFPLLERNPDVFFTVVTNGLLLDAATARRLARAANAMPFLSIDGFRERNDEWRGVGVFDRVLAAMGHLRRARVAFGFGVTVTARNFDEVTSAAFLDFMVAQGAYYGAYSPWGPAGRNPGYDHMLAAPQVEELFARLDRLERTRPLLFHKEGHRDGTPLNPGCGAGRVVNVLPDGAVEPCNGIHFSAGNVHTLPLAQILRHPFYAALRACADASADRRCIGLYRTRDVIRLVGGDGVRPTNPDVPCQLRSLLEYLEARDRPGLLQGVPTVGARS